MLINVKLTVGWYHYWLQMILIMCNNDTNMKTINTRQKRILKLIEKSVGSVNFGAVESAISGVSKTTLKRDLKLLKQQRLIKKSGSTRDATYSLHESYLLFREYDRKRYYSADKQQGPTLSFGGVKKFNPDIFLALETELFTEREIKSLESLNEQYQANIGKLEEFYKKREYERLSIEFSWKSSHIEGNTYSYLETEHLLKENKEPAGHTAEEKQMILNHKQTIDDLLRNPEKYIELSKSNILDTHYSLVKNLEIPSGLRQRPVRIGGSSYIPPNGVVEIENWLLKMVELINSKQSVYEKALLSLLLVAYIQPFADGNKRTSRMICNGILLAHGHCPLSLRDLDELRYKEAMVLFYEQNSLVLLKEIFVEQYRYVVENYFLV